MALDKFFDLCLTHGLLVTEGFLIFNGVETIWQVFERNSSVFASCQFISVRSDNKTANRQPALVGDRKWQI